MLSAISAFSGVGGIDLGLERAGIRIVAQCEADPYRRRVLARHWPGVPCFEDVREVAASGGGRPESRELGGERHGSDGRRDRPWTEDGNGSADLCCGGFPCQDLSIAGRRAGLAGERSSLVFEFARIADELVRPGGWILVENVPGLLSGCSCQGCKQCRELLRLHSAGWRVASRDAGRGDRDRLFADGEAERPDGAKRPGRCPCSRCDLARRLLAAHDGTEFAVVRALFGEIGFHDLAWRVLDSRYFGVPQRRRRVFIVGRRARGRCAAEVLLEPESGGGDLEAGKQEGSRVAASLSRGSSSSGVSAPGRRQEDDENIVGPLLSGKASGWRGDDHEAASGYFQVVGALDQQRGGADDTGAQAGHLVAHSLRAEGFDASEDGTGRGTPLVPNGGRAPAGISGRLDVDAVDALVSRSSRGRPTPLAPGHNTDSHIALGGGEPTDSCALDLQPDGPRYAACGDAVTVNVAEWIGRRILDYEQRKAA